MRRKEKEITDPDQLTAILTETDICRLGLVDNGKPYIIPMNFGYANHSLYFHSAPDGRKLDILRRNPFACFEVEIQTEIIKASRACKFGMKFKSVIGTGHISFIKDLPDKEQALKIILSHYSEKQEWEFDIPLLEKCAVFRLDIEEMSGKTSGLSS